MVNVPRRSLRRKVATPPPAELQAAPRRARLTRKAQKTRFATNSEAHHVHDAVTSVRGSYSVGDELLSFDLGRSLQPGSSNIPIPPIDPPTILFIKATAARVHDSMVNVPRRSPRRRPATPPPAQAPPRRARLTRKAQKVRFAVDPEARDAHDAADSEAPSTTSDDHEDWSDLSTSAGYSVVQAPTVGILVDAALDLTDGRDRSVLTSVLS
ncbi:hypothetical protein AURDEDRAFT_177742 [Auricularia subglabra TFB-10046 SS5]|uniref:Uncharacterized protein n=1 Tax=Auricularia subglabra (strain TFB-10046 / SS5) TaxID=717982 RepID=J0L9V7_AURST|nr:hypothetical protein AURDEDRAFT_177742 [Auricularia subglabra TFB-10046 SS5]